MAIDSPVTTVSWLRNDDLSHAQNWTDKSILGKDDFLKLLLAELKYQDPMEPMKDREFIAQMASFSSLEQMANLNTGFKDLAGVITNQLIPQIMWQQSSQMLGKEVTYVNPDAEGEEDRFLTGLVTSVLVKDGQIHYVVNGKEIPDSSVVKISAAADPNQKLMADILKQLEELGEGKVSTEEEVHG